MSETNLTLFSHAGRAVPVSAENVLWIVQAEGRRGWRELTRFPVVPLERTACKSTIFKQIYRTPRSEELSSCLYLKNQFKHIL